MVDILLIIASLALVVTLFGLVTYPWYRSALAGRFDPFEPMVFYAIFAAMNTAVLADRLFLAEPDYVRDVSYAWPDGLLLAGGAFAVSIAAILVGYYRLGPHIPRLIYRGSRPQILLDAIERAPARAYYALALIYAAVGLASFLAIVVFVFPTSEFLYMFTRGQPRSLVFEGSGVLVLGTRMLYVGYFLWLTGALVERRAPTLAELAGFVPVAGMILLLGGRGRVMMITIVVAVLLYYVFVQESISIYRGRLARFTGRVSPLTTLLVLPLLGLILAAPILMLRGLRRGQSLRESLAGVDAVAIATAGVQNAMFDYFLALTEVVPSEIGYYYGTFYARAVLNFIPRAVWPEKPPLYAGAVLRETIMPDGAGGRSPGAIGTYYMNFGWLGIPLLAALYGVALHLLYRLVRDEKTSPVRLLVFAIVLANFGRSGITNGALHQILTHVILLMPAAVVLYAISKHHSTVRSWLSFG